MSSPVFYGQDFRPNVGSASNASDFDVRLSHPACFGFKKGVKIEPTTKQDEELPKKDRRKATQSKPLLDRLILGRIAQIFCTILL